ncbi:MAG: hypothetical protein ACYDAQ_06455 [Mycobacteriales bacterium]
MTAAALTLTLSAAAACAPPTPEQLQRQVARGNVVAQVRFESKRVCGPTPAAPVAGSPFASPSPLAASGDTVDLSDVAPTPVLVMTVGESVAIRAVWGPAGTYPVFACDSKVLTALRYDTHATASRSGRPQYFTVTWFRAEHPGVTNVTAESLSYASLTAPVFSLVVVVTRGGVTPTSTKAPAG